MVRDPAFAFRAPNGAPTQFRYFQAMPMEIQCMVWAEFPLPALLPVNYHAYPKMAKEDWPKGLYTGHQLEFRRRLMRLCKSAWLTYTLKHKLYHFLRQSEGALFSVTERSIIPDDQLIRDPYSTIPALRLDPKRDVLSRQYELILEPRGSTVYPRMYAQKGLEVEVDALTKSAGSAAQGDESIIARHTDDNPNLVRHIHVDMLVRRAGSTPPVGVENHMSSYFFWRTTTASQNTTANLQTITISLNGPGALHKVIRLVKLPELESTRTPTNIPTTLLPEPVSYHDTIKPGDFWSTNDIAMIIRSDGALITTPRRILRCVGFAVFRVVTPLGPESEHDPLEAFNNDPRQWREVLETCSRIARMPVSPPKTPESLVFRISELIIQDAFYWPWWVDGICGPNYAMEEARVFG
ncbi:hypothetical protein V8F20_007121 [Naviculisporaceae sp. PSN 640]